MLNVATAMSPKPVYTAEGFESQLAGNHIGTFLLVSLLLPRLRQASPGARVLAISSDALEVSKPRFDDINYKLRPEEYGELIARQWYNGLVNYPWLYNSS